MRQLMTKASLKIIAPFSPGRPTTTLASRDTGNSIRFSNQLIFGVEIQNIAWMAGNPTEWEGLVQLTSLNQLDLLLLVLQALFTFLQLNCTEPSTSVNAPCLGGFLVPTAQYCALDSFSSQ
jgi:hypothetical protein